MFDYKSEAKEYTRRKPWTYDIAKDFCGDFFAFIGDFLLQKKKMPTGASFWNLIFGFKISKIFSRFREIWLQRFFEPPTPAFRVKISFRKF